MATKAAIESADEIFLAIAAKHGLLDAEELELLRGLRSLDRLRGQRPRSIARLCVREGLLEAREARGLQRGVRYYLIRKVDRRYARAALKLGLIPWWAYHQALADQKRAFHEGRRLTRVLPLLRAAGFVGQAEHEAVQAALATAEKKGAARPRSRRAPATGSRPSLRPAAPRSSRRAAAAAAAPASPTSSRRRARRRSGESSRSARG